MNMLKVETVEPVKMYKEKKEEKPKEQPKAKVKKPAVEKEPQYYRSKTNNTDVKL